MEDGINTSLEIWKPIPGYKIYEASNLGRVRSIDRVETIKNQWGGTTTRSVSGRVLIDTSNGKGYRIVNAYRGRGFAPTAYVHRLVCAAFYGEIPDGFCVNHKNGNKSDNSTDNLEICNYSENIKHAIRTKLISKDNSGGLILTPSDVKTIRFFYKRGSTTRILAKIFKKSTTTIVAIARFKIHKDV